MKKILFVIVLICFSILVACNNSAEDSDSNQNMAEKSVEEEAANDNNANMDMEDGQAEEAESANKKDHHSDRKVIYTGDLQIEVQDYEKAFNDIDKQIAELDGYIVDSTMNEEEENGSKHGYLTARIPQKDFKTFMRSVEKGSSKVLQSSTSGEDVTEEYVDLESRLKSKEVVEDRLSTFMEEAEKTEDLLKISDDLATVQEEIEELKGRIKYLDDKSDLATITIDMQEKNVALSGTSKNDLNTWDKTKEQLIKSIDFLIVAFSGIFVFIVGNLPIFLLLGLIAVVVSFIVRKQMEKRKKD